MSSPDILDSGRAGGMAIRGGFDLVVVGSIARDWHCGSTSTTGCRAP